MCKYCKRLEDLRKSERKVFDYVLARYKKELKKDERLFRRCLSFMDKCYLKLELPPFLTDEYGELSIELENLLNLESEVKDDA